MPKMSQQQTDEFFRCILGLKELLKRYCLGLECLEERKIQLNRVYVRSWMELEDCHAYEKCAYALMVDFKFYIF